MTMLEQGWIHYFMQCDKKCLQLDLNSKVLVWKGSCDGNFSMKAAWQMSRLQGVLNVTTAGIWGTQIDPSAQLIGWKVLMKALPLDARIRQLGIPMVSRCCLCYKEEESVEHLFVDCVFASAIWNRLVGLIGFHIIRGEYPMVRMRRIWRIYKKQSIAHALNGSIPLLIF